MMSIPLPMLKAVIVSLLYQACFSDQHLINAVQKGTIDHIKHHVETLKKDVNHADQWKHHVIKHAAHRGDVDIGHYLIQQGANPHVRTNEGRTTLHAAAHQGRFEMVQFLLDHGVNIDTVDHRFGYTALMMAISELHHGHIQKEHEKVIRLLIDKGSDLFNIRGTRNGKNCLDIMEKKKLQHPRLYKHMHAKAEEQKLKVVKEAETLLQEANEVQQNEL